VKVSELSAASGVSVATIKYYRREGLLPPGASTAPKQAEYGPEHLRRLRLIRALADLGKVPVAEIRRVLDAIDDPDLDTHEVLLIAHRALSPEPPAEPPPEVQEARTSVDGFLDKLGWQVSADAPGRDDLAHALATLQRLDWDVDARAFDRYARAADRLAAGELVQTALQQDRQDAVEEIVVGTVVFEMVFAALRRLAQEHHSALRFSSVSAAVPPRARRSRSASRR
jgi:DNA-binding transcriptional MerR regulator